MQRRDSRFTGNIDSIKEMVLWCHSLVSEVLFWSIKCLWVLMLPPSWLQKMDAMRKTGSDFETTCLLWMMACDLQLVSQWLCGFMPQISLHFHIGLQSLCFVNKMYTQPRKFMCKVVSLCRTTLMGGYLRKVRCPGSSTTTNRCRGQSL